MKISSCHNTTPSSLWMCDMKSSMSSHAAATYFLLTPRQNQTPDSHHSGAIQKMKQINFSLRGCVQINCHHNQQSIPESNLVTMLGLTVQVGGTFIQKPGGKSIECRPLRRTPLLFVVNKVLFGTLNFNSFPITFFSHLHKPATRVGC